MENSWLLNNLPHIYIKKGGGFSIALFLCPLSIIKDLLINHSPYSARKDHFVIGKGLDQRTRKSAVPLNPFHSKDQLSSLTSQLLLVSLYRTSSLYCEIPLPSHYILRTPQ